MELSSTDEDLNSHQASVTPSNNSPNSNGSNDNSSNQEEQIQQASQSLKESASEEVEFDNGESEQVNSNDQDAMANDEISEQPAQNSEHEEEESEDADDESDDEETHHQSPNVGEVQQGTKEQQVRDGPEIQLERDQEDFQPDENLPIPSLAHLSPAGADDFYPPHSSPPPIPHHYDMPSSSSAEAQIPSSLRNLLEGHFATLHSSITALDTKVEQKTMMLESRLESIEQRLSENVGRQETIQRFTAVRSDQLVQTIGMVVSTLDQVVSTPCSKHKTKSCKTGQVVSTLVQDNVSTLSQVVSTLETFPEHHLGSFGIVCRHYVK
ncbi:hypothetical protein Taro_048629 [Colocasia esculenta]|uniref:Uncharacterized protein n=1 Tax=Colocasia esculenta TaxID=4460 RepID=A0A843X8P0_COLES|nr:hypothetical protein [Colocasia esculenta]